MTTKKQLITYRQLRNILNNEFTEQELDQNVVAYLNPEDEFVPIATISITDDQEDRLDPGSVYFSV